MVRTARSRERNTGVQGDLLLAHQRVGRDAGDARHLRVSPCRSRARQRGARQPIDWRLLAGTAMIVAGIVVVNACVFATLGSRAVSKN